MNDHMNVLLRLFVLSSQGFSMSNTDRPFIHRKVKERKILLARENKQRDTI